MDLNRLARMVALSDAVQRTDRPPISVVAASSELDPIAHALQEIDGLLPGFTDPADRARLESYREALRSLQAKQPFQ